MTKLALLERLPPLTMSELFDELLLSPMMTPPFTVSDPPPVIVIELELLVLPSANPATVPGMVSTGELPLVPLSTRTVWLG